MSADTITQLFTLASGHQWLPLALLILGLITAALHDTSKFPVNIPDRWRPVIVIILGQVYAVLDAVEGGTPVGTAVVHGLAISFGTLGLAHLLVTAVFNGKVPSWLTWFFDPTLVQAKKLGIKLEGPVFGKKTLPEPTNFQRAAPPPLPKERV